MKTETEVQMERYDIAIIGTGPAGSGGDVGRAVVAGRHRTRGGDRQLERGELAEQQHSQQQGKDSGCMFAGCHCK